MVIKLIRIIVQKRNLEINKKIAIFWHTYCQYCQLGFSSKIEVPQLGSARNFYNSGSLKPENSSSNSSLQYLRLTTSNKFWWDLSFIKWVNEKDPKYFWVNLPVDKLTDRVKNLPQSSEVFCTYDRYFHEKAFIF